MLRALGCIFLLILIGGAAFFTRGLWMPFISDRPDTTMLTDVSTWQSLTPEGAQRARTALQRLQSPRGPAYMNVAPGDLAAYIAQELARSLPSSSDSIQAAAIGDRLHVRTTIRTSDLGNRSDLGPLALLLGERERLELAGTIRIIRPGSGELQVKELRIRDFPLPAALIPRIVRQMSRGTRPAELSPDGLPIATPAYIGDVRIANGQITLYRATAPSPSSGAQR
jgi:hypothetical protein